MGWCSATSIFDGVVNAALESEINDDALFNIVSSLYHELTMMDWDCICDSQYFNEPRIKSILKEIDSSLHFNDEEE